MSFFDDASLAFLPNAGKDGKAYSIKPTDGTGDFTFSRGSNLAATRVNADGLIEKGRENLLLQSNQFDTTWTRYQTSLTSNQVGYDASNDAWLLEASPTGLLTQVVANSGIQTFSVYAKAGTTDWMKIRFFGGSTTYINFDLNPSTTGSRIGDSQLVIDAATEDVGNGWFRCSFSINNATTSFRIRPMSGDNIDAIAGDNIYIQDAQLEAGLVATDYIESGASTGKAGLLEDEPRFDYSGGATCPSLLLEPSRTNLVPYSEYFSDSYYIKDSGISTIENQLLSPEGLLNACKVSVNNSNRIYANNVVDNNTFSVFIKAGTFSHFRVVGENIDLTTNPISVGALDFVDYGNGWYRLYWTSTTSRGFQIQAYPDNTYSTHTTSGDYYIYGHQLEQASYPTSYIPNHSGGSVTRGADDATNTGTIDADNDFTLYLETAPLSEATAVPTYFSSSGMGFLSHNTISSLRYRLNSSSYTFSLVGLNTFKFALKYDGTNLYTFYNGVKVHTISASLSGSQDIDFEGGKHKQFLVFPEALSDADCISLTTL